jgi:arabinogalactan oligomer/maltooligosaccharide transport system substrate-binding protein
MPAIPAMSSVWAYWGVAEAAIINGADPVATWQKLAADVLAAIS